MSVEWVVLVLPLGNRADGSIPIVQIKTLELREAVNFSESHTWKSTGPREGPESLSAVPWGQTSLDVSLDIFMQPHVLNMVAWLQYWFPLECKCVFSLSCPTVADFLLFWFIFQIWIKMSSHQFSSHLPQPSSTLFPFFCLWPFTSFSPISPCPFTLLSSCCHCASENVASYNSPTSLESQEWDPQGVESLAQRRRGIALGYSGPLAVDCQDPHSVAYSLMGLCTHKAWDKSGPQSRVEDASLGPGLPSDQPGLLEYFQIVTLLWQKLGSLFCILSFRVSPLLIYS